PRTGVRRLVRVNSVEAASAPRGVRDSTIPRARSGRVPPFSKLGIRPGSESGNKPLSEERFPKKPVSPMLARGSQSHDQHGGNRHGLSGYVFARSAAIGPLSRP